MSSLSIGEVAAKVGVQPSTLRYYERAGVLPEPERVSGRRRYSQDVLKRLAIIQLAQQSGFTLAEIRTLFEGIGPDTSPSELWKALAETLLKIMPPLTIT